MQLNQLLQPMECPELIDFVDFASGQLDMFNYGNALLEYEDRKREMPDTVEKSNKRPFRHRKTYTRRDPKTSFWWLDYVLDEDRTWRDPTHRNGKLFRFRFSHNFDSVQEIIAKIQEGEHYFWRNKTDNKGKPSSPIELLVLGSLRILTRNVTLDDLVEQTFISSEVHRCFFSKFMMWYSSVVFPLVVRMPLVAELYDNGAEYRVSGFPGCVCSVDCVHVRVWGVAANLKQVSTGKEKFPSRVFEAAVNHRGMIVSATKGFYGSVSDKSIVKFDGAMMAMKNGLYDANTYELYNDEGILYTVEGAYNLCDNGYHKWSTMMEPSKRPADVDDYNWTEMLESLRKDVECLFGELKQEFAVLKYGTRFNDLAVMDNIFLTCCAIHNHRKTLAGLNEMWNLDQIITQEIDDDLSQESTAVFRRLQEYERLEAIPQEDNNGMGGGENLILPFDDNVVEEHDMSHDVVKQRLITHFKWANKKNEVFWATRNGSITKYNLASER